VAVTLTADLIQISAAEDGGLGTWYSAKGGFDAEVKVQQSFSYGWQAGKNAVTTCTFTPASNIDMTAAGYSNVHVFFWMKCDAFPFAEPKRTGTSARSGLLFRMTDGSGNYKEWHVAGSDTWGGEWRCFVIDTSNTSQLYASSGTLSLADIDVFTWTIDLSNSGIIRIITNTWNDVCYYGEGLTATGTDFDLVDICEANDNLIYKYGILENVDGVIFCQGKLKIGNGATVTTFNSSDEVLIYRDAVGDGKRGFVHTDLYDLIFSGSGCAANISGLICKGAGTTDVTRPKITHSDTNASVTIDGSSFIHTKTVTFCSTSDTRNSVFSDCFQITPSTGDFKYNSITDYVGTAGGAVLLPLSCTNLNNLTFIDNLYSIECATVSSVYALSNCSFFDPGSAAIAYINNSTAATVVDQFTTAPDSTWLMYGGTRQGVGQEFTGSTGILSSATFKLLAAVGSPTGNIYAELYASDGSKPTGSVLATSNALSAQTLTGVATDYHFEFEDKYSLAAQNYFIALKYTGGNASNAVGVRVVVAGGHGGESAYTNDHVTWNSATAPDVYFKVRKNGIVEISSTETTFEGGPPTAVQTNSVPGATIISASVNVNIHVQDETQTDIYLAQVAVYDENEEELFNGDTDIDGDVLFSFSGTTPASIIIKVRKSSTGDTKYLPYSGAAIISEAGLSTIITLYEDTVAK